MWCCSQSVTSPSRSPKSDSVIAGDGTTLTAPLPRAAGSGLTVTLGDWLRAGGKGDEGSGSVLHRVELGPPVAGAVAHAGRGVDDERDVRVDLALAARLAKKQGQV